MRYTHRTLSAFIILAFCSCKSGRSNIEVQPSSSNDIPNANVGLPTLEPLPEPQASLKITLVPGNAFSPDDVTIDVSPMEEGRGSGFAGPLSQLDQMSFKAQENYRIKVEVQAAGRAGPYGSTGCGNESQYKLLGGMNVITLKICPASDVTINPVLSDDTAEELDNP
ncbi:hypothetical protein [Pseudobacteriovorax antillogorgiicola]|uniref:Lipoprotein n=1 Tax=Pseudobacteriovorax antillogorgiicola TaxID=1513793 RepID=A0A1Y6BM41_9BACT|nr:hypothetical protein [Pseudobacteriovorax antillogorgiicola]TCS55302.1 hypothetical protein EDD56_10523 [Pseudobacteriovorax antillogorgiicola]SMF14451.1 hypothetical protein SAMN06296036_105301 [Pseudobacteriovorax antillogorgiicola]